MSSVKDIKPPTAYRPDGVVELYVLEYVGFEGFKFVNDGLCDTCLVTGVQYTGDLIRIDTPDGAKYSSSLQSSIYTHKVEAFIGDISADMSSVLHTLTKRRVLPVFKTTTGRYLCFGYDAGASVSYGNQTNDGLGSTIVITAKSIHPVFEVEGQVLNELRMHSLVMPAQR